LNIQSDFFKLDNIFKAFSWKDKIFATLELKIKVYENKHLIFFSIHQQNIGQLKV